MNPTARDEHRLAELMTALQCESITEAEAAELAAMLADPELRRLYVERTMLWSALDHRAAAESKAPQPIPIYRKGCEPNPKSETRIPKFAIYSGVAAAVLAACGLAIYVLSLNPEPSPPEPSTAPLATLIETTGGHLTTPSGYAAEGREYAAGEYTLDAGYAQFVLTNRVTVDLRGETRLRMHHPKSVYLERGNAEFNVPKDATGFTVHLPDRSKIVDLGTAFRIEVDEAGRSKLRVTSGSVAWTGAANGAPAVIIEAGQAAYVAEGRVVIRKPLVAQLGILDLKANDGINPATGEPWEPGDTYRLIFTTSGLTPATASDIAFYNAFVQSAADATEAYGIGADEGVTWKAIVSTDTVDARDNTHTNVETDGPGEAIFLLDGETLVAKDYAALYGDNESHKNTIRLTELGTKPAEADYGSTWTGSSADGTAQAGDALGTADGTSIVGLWGFTTGAHWIQRFADRDQTERRPLYAISQPLVVAERDNDATESETQHRQRAGDTTRKE